VLAAVEDQILTQKLRVGDRLPSERDLAEALGVSRPSVREALRVLEWMGVVVAGVGSGKDAGSIITAQSSEALARLLRIHLALANFGLDDLVEVRIILEAATVEAAAVYATVDDLQALGRVLEQMANPDLGHKQFNELDTEFHVGIALASGNKVLGELMAALRDALELEMIRAFERLGPDWKKATRKLQGEHAKVLQSIKMGDGPGASAALRQHIRSFYNSTRKSRQQGVPSAPNGSRHRKQTATAQPEEPEKKAR
jgi:DNA-binding FadR family transcriptional regulator